MKPHGDDRKKFDSIVWSILREMPEMGGTRDCVDYVKVHDGKLGEYIDAVFEIALEESVKRILRHKRLPENKNIPAFPSMEVETGEFDDDGIPVTKRVFASMEQLLFDKRWTEIKSIVNYRVRSIRGQMAVTNAIVKAARVRGFQGKLPFPELDDEIEDSA
jgi:hypothetical protein